MKARLAAIASAGVVLVGLMGAPVVPVMVGSALAWAWLRYREQRDMGGA